MTDLFAKCRNPDGKTYNGVALLSQLTKGVVSEAEILWTFNRMKSLLKEGKSPTQARLIASEEAKSSPWLTQSPHKEVHTP